MKNHYESEIAVLRRNLVCILSIYFGLTVILRLAWQMGFLELLTRLDVFIVDTHLRRKGLEESLYGTGELQVGEKAI